LHEPNHSRINLPDEAATTDFAVQLARILQPGLVIYLRGDLGAGKTTLVRGMLRSLGYDGRVKSPTYTLIEHYDLAELKLRHFDLYRFRDAEEWEAAGFRDEFNGRNICLVEWPEQAEELLPVADLEIIFTIRPDGRILDLYAHTDTGNQCLTRLIH
jgi:tRNA threonylcarbamoyladenosine biosynthesis protein TsaE